MDKGGIIRRRQYFVAKRFQVKYIGLILAAMFSGVIIAGITIYYNSWVLLGEKLANVYPQGQLVQIFKSVNLKLALNIVVIGVICTIIGVFASHKIAGPIFRMVRFVDSVAGGDYSKRLKLRKGDELQDLADAINRLVEKLEEGKK